MREKDLRGHFTQKDATELDGGSAPPTRILEHEQSSDDDAAPEEGLSVPGEGEEEELDVQLVRAVEVLKSWTYFEDLRRQREERGGQAGEGSTVAAAEGS